MSERKKARCAEGHSSGPRRGALRCGRLSEGPATREVTWKKLLMGREPKGPPGREPKGPPAPSAEKAPGAAAKAGREEEEEEEEEEGEASPPRAKGWDARGRARREAMPDRSPLLNMMTGAVVKL